MLRVFMMPTPEQALSDRSNAINQIVLRLRDHFPKYGLELVAPPEPERQDGRLIYPGIDLVVGNAGQTDGKTVVDYAMCHGLYPTAHANQYDTPTWHWAANKGVIENIRTARGVSVPSQWVADILRRDLHLNPDVVGWAIEPSEWGPGTDEGYVLWAKTRDDGVCTSKPLVELAARAPEQRFLTTFGQGYPNIRTIGRQTFEAIKPIIQGASVYLATSLETFGIQTLEAMACGIPVLGFKWGGTADIVEHGVSGFLAEPGDYDGLRAGLDYCLKYRATLGANARAVALTYTWDKVAEQFAALYQSVLQPHVGPKVSVVIPCHNYAGYVGQAIDSVKAQVATFPVEIIVVTDRCTDDSESVVVDHLQGVEHAEWLSADYGNPADTRNQGIAHARGEYICCLDADDKLGDPRFLQTLADAMDKDRSLGIAFAGLRIMGADGNLAPGASEWPKGYNYDQQCVRHNQVPTCCLFRKEAWMRAGGYRRRYCPAEDADLWLRIGALGYRGMQVTAEPWFYYRLHSNSLSTAVRTAQKAEPDWVGDKPWTSDNKRPFAADGQPILHSWPVRNYHQPKVTVVIPVGPGHENLLPEALDSVECQTERFWECIVVNDTGKPLDLPAYPWARVIDGGKRGAGHARNTGVEYASAPLVAFLDADDVFAPRFLELTLRAYARAGRYVYTDWISLNKDGVQEVHTTPEYLPNEVFRRTSIHSINVLIRKADVLAVGGFDEQMTSWEDVDFFMKLAAAGICGQRVPEPLVLYRYSTGNLRERGETMKDDLKAMLRQRFRDYIEDGKMCGCTQPKQITQTMQTNQTTANGNGQGAMVRIEYNGPAGMHPVVGSITKQNYGRRSGGDTFYVYAVDQADQPTRFVPIVEVGTVIEPTAVPGEPVPL